MHPAMELTVIHFKWAQLFVCHIIHLLLNTTPLPITQQPALIHH